MSSAEQLLQSLVNNNHDVIDSLLARDDVTTWINDKVDIRKVESYNSTSDNDMTAEQEEDSNIHFDSVLGFVSACRSVETLSKVLSAGADIRTTGQFNNMKQ